MFIDRITVVVTRMEFVCGTESSSHSHQVTERPKAVDSCVYSV